MMNLMDVTKTPAVYGAIAAVQAELATKGIAKSRTAKTFGSEDGGGTYSFRGIDDMYNALAPLLSKHGLCVLPRMAQRTVADRLTAKGKQLFVVTVRAEFDFVAVADGSTHTVVTYGEAMDTSDKATNKAMSAAYKYAVMQAFAIPLMGNEADSESQDHEVAGELTAEQATALQKIRDASLNGQKALDAAWAGIGKENRIKLAPHLDALKEAATKAEADTAGKRG